MKTYKLGSRGSELALCQSNMVREMLEGIGILCSIEIIKTQGDNIPDKPLQNLDGKGFFTKEIEDALIAKEIDIAVHSYKDLPTSSPVELTIAAIPKRENPADTLIINKKAIDRTKKYDLKDSAVVGTSSSRRKAGLLAGRPDLVFNDIRGNLPTRLKKLRSGAYDAIVLAQAGINRLGIDLSNFQVITLNPANIVPAPGQGALAIQTRKEDEALIYELRKITDLNTEAAIKVERKIMHHFEGGCNLPLGAYCCLKNNEWHLWFSKSETWENLPQRLFKKSDLPENLANQLIEAHNNIRPHSIFITRDLNEHSLLENTLKAHGYKVAGESLIQFTPLSFEFKNQVNWIFFSSKTSVRFFMERKPDIDKSTLLAAIGPGTAEAIGSFGYSVAYQGTSSDTKVTGKEFAKIAEGKTVLFPQGQQATGSVMSQLHSATKALTTEVYTTEFRTGFDLPTAETIIFTSPSNVSSFINNYSLTSFQNVIAIGPTTSSRLEAFGIKNIITTDRPDDNALLETIFGLNEILD